MFLAGPFNMEKDPQIREIFEGQDAVLFGKGADLDYEFGRDSYADLTGKTGGIKPEFLLFFMPEFFGVPAGIEDSPFPAVAIISDWGVNLEAMARIAPFFSRLVVDYPGLETFRGLGFQNVTYVPLYGFYPSLHKRMPEVEKIYDVTMIGNLNDLVHSARSRYLKRLSNFYPRYNIKFLTGLYGEDYARTVNASKITFNHSIRGEMNLRCYEALACGSLLFLEEENQEARLYLKDRVHCVYYNEWNLEKLLEHFLTDGEEREAIVRKGWEFIQDFALPRQLQRLLAAVRSVGTESGWSVPPALAWDEEKRARHRIFHAFHASEFSRMAVVAQSLSCLRPESREARFLSGFLLLEWATQYVPPGEQGPFFEVALVLFRKAAQADPLFFPAFYNHALTLFLLGRHREAVVGFEAALRVIRQGGGGDVEFGSLLSPIVYHAWRLEKEKRFKEGTAHAEAFLSARCLESLGDAYSACGEDGKAAEAYHQARAFGANEAELSRRHGNALEKTGDLAAAAASYERALESRPLFLEVWKALPRLYQALGEREKLEKFCDEVSRVMACIPSFDGLKAEFEAWREVVGAP